VVELVRRLLRIGRRFQVQTLAEVIFFAISYLQIFKMLLALIIIWRAKELIYDFIQLSLEMRTSPTNCRRAVQKITEKFEKLYFKYIQ